MAKRLIRQDKISNLPLPLLHRILSFLPTQDVVRTCVLSKHWRTIWCSAHSLNFYEDSSPQVDKFLKLVNSVLLLRDASNIQKLLLRLSHMNGDLEMLNTWILHVLKHNVQVLDMVINVYDDDYMNANADLTPCVLASESLRELKLSYGNYLNRPASIRLPALKNLNLNFVHGKNGLLEDILSASPSLETLILRNCTFECSCLSISGCQLRKLNIGGCSPSSLVISAPNLVSLRLDIDCRSPATIRFNGDMLSLDDAIINIIRICSESLVHLISTVRNAQSLSLAFYGCSLSPFAVELKKNLSLLNRIKIPFDNLKALRILTFFNDVDLILINYILKHSPAVESIFLATERVMSMSRANQVQHFEVGKVWSVYNLFHLKVVRIEGFRGSENEVKLVKFLLENAVVLEKMVILLAKSKDCSVDNKEMMKIGQNLLTHPRASSSVGILFTQDL